MAGIDYTIPGQFKGVQIEPPENAMMRAMQLRGLQESSQMNALKMQEYQQDVMEKNALAQIYANPKLKYGSPEFFAQVAQHAPRYYEKIATGEAQRLTGEAQRQTALATQQTREQQAEAAQLKNRETRRAAAIGQIASARSPREALEMSQDFFAAGDIGQRDVNSLMDELYNAPNMEDFSKRRRVGLLEPDKALAESRATEEAGQKRFKANVEQTDARLKEFNEAFPALSIRSEADVAERIRAMATDEILGPLSQRFGSLESIIARNVAEYKRNPINYVKRLSGVSAVEMLKTAEEKENQEYSQYRLNELLNRRQPLTPEEYFKRARGAAAAPAAALAVVDAAPAVATVTAPKAAYVEGLLGSERPAAATDQTATPAAAADATAAASTKQEIPAETPVVKEDRVFGVDLLDPDAQALYTAAASEKDPTAKETYFKLAEKIQTESAARRRNQEYTGTYQNVDIALRELERLKKEPPTPDIQNRIKVLQGLIDAAQVPVRPPTPTDISKKEDEREALQKRLDAATDPDVKKNLRERIKRLTADIKGDVYGREKTPATTPVQDALIAKAVLDKRLDPMKLNSRNIATVAKILEADPNANLKELSIDAMSGAASSKALATQQAKILTAANEADSMIKIVRNASAKIDRTQYPTINAIQNAVDKGTGGKEIVKLNTALNALINSYARAINPTGVATVSDKNHAREIINSNYASGQLDAILDVMQEEMRVAKASPGEASQQLKEQRNTPKPVGTIDKNNKWLK